MSGISTDTYLRLFLPGYAIGARIYELANPGKTLDVGSVVEGKGTQHIVTDKPTGPSPANLDFIESFIADALKDPLEFAGRFRATATGAAVALALVSLIPTEANFGGPTASRLIDRLLAPFFSKVYGGPIENFLDSYFPTQEVGPRMLVSAVEAGGIEIPDLLEQLIEGGVKPKARDIIVRYARIKQFEVANKDDMALLRTYQTDLTRAQIATRQDELKVVLADLKAQRTALKAELKRVQATLVV